MALEDAYSENESVETYNNIRRVSTKLSRHLHIAKAMGSTDYGTSHSIVELSRLMKDVPPPIHDEKDLATVIGLSRDDFDICKEQQTMQLDLKKYGELSVDRLQRMAEEGVLTHAQYTALLDIAIQKNKATDKGRIDGTIVVKGDNAVLSMLSGLDSGTN